MGSKNEDDDSAKPVTGYAPPPLSAILSLAAFTGLSIYYLPTTTPVPPDLFVRRVFPEYLNVEALLCIRAFFTVICCVGFASGWLTPPIEVRPPYRPYSKLPRLPFTLKGWGKQFPFTSWSWNLLGICFGLSTYIGYQIQYNDDSNNVDNSTVVPSWLVHLTFILWEVSAPITLLIGAVVKYALWPAQIKETGSGDAFLTPRALLQHNANVIMAVADVALLGGLPVRMADIPISVLYGCSYVVFTYSIMMTWHGQGPAFLYYFFDTTLGTEHTIALIVLVLVLMIFYGLFCTAEHVLSMMGHTIVGHVGFTIALCALVCRFRD